MFHLITRSFCHFLSYRQEERLSLLPHLLPYLTPPHHRRLCSLDLKQRRAKTEDLVFDPFRLTKIFLFFLYLQIEEH